MIQTSAEPDWVPFDETTGEPDPNFGRFKNTASPPALTFFHYRAGDYEVTLDDPADFGTLSEIIITFTSINAIDINIHAPALFPPLAAGPVSFHADFNRFSSPPIFSSDALPTNTALGPESFEASTVSLIPPGGEVSGGNVTSLALTAQAASGDYNDNGQVEQADLDLVLLNWGQPFDGLPSEWVNERPTMGIVDQAELDGVLLNWGTSADAAAVPEPATWLMVAIACLAYLTFARREKHSRHLSRKLLRRDFLSSTKCSLCG